MVKNTIQIAPKNSCFNLQKLASFVGETQSYTRVASTLGLEQFILQRTTRQGTTLLYFSANAMSKEPLSTSFEV